MKTTVIGAIACAVFLAVPMTASAGTNYGCDSVNFSQEVLGKLPNAQRLCRGVMEKNGGVYVKYVAKVVDSSADSTTVEFIDKDGKAVSRATFKPSADQMAELNGKKMKYADVPKGTELHFYIEHNKWGLFSSPDSKAMTIVNVEQL